MEERADTFEAIVKSDGDGIEGDAPRLLEVRELGDLQTIQQHLPADPPRAEGGRFPVVFFKTNVVLFQVDADGAQALQIEILHIDRRRFEDDLKLGVLIKAIRILAVPTVGGNPNRLYKHTQFQVILKPSQIGRAHV